MIRTSARFPSRRSHSLTCVAVLAAGTLLLGCAVPGTALSQTRTRQTDPPVAEQRRHEPDASFMRAALGLPFIEEAQLEEMIYELASPAFAGRLTGTAGYDLAARFGVEHMRAAGLQPGGPEGTWLQPFTVETNLITGPMELRVEHEGWRGAPYRFGRDYVARGFTGSGRIESAEVVFVGYGLVDNEGDWDDYAGIDTRGKAALMFMGAPRNGVDWGERSRPRYKATVAKERGAVAILLIDDPGDGVLSPIVSVYHGMVGSQQTDLPQLSIRNRIADDLLYGLPHTAVNLRRAINESGGSHSMELNTRVTIEAHAEYTAEAQTWNVVGWIEGSDPAVRDEWVVVGGHLDHVGQQADMLCAGAQDNASGSVMVLGMAAAMARAPVKPRRSVCFVLFAGEELFLLGSEYFASDPPRPIENCVGMINLDMVGTGPRLAMDGGATTPIFQEFVEQADRYYGGLGIAERDPTQIRAGASDHSAFVNAGVPTVYFHSSGARGRAHTPEDVPETIDYDAFYRTTRVVYMTLFQMADRP